MSAKQTAPTAVLASDAVIEAFVRNAAGTSVWCEINGADSTDVVNGEVPVNEVPTYRGTVTQEGELTKPDITIGLSSYIPYLPVMRELKRLYEAKQPVSIRWYNPGREFIPLSSGSNNTVAIAANTGLVSFNSGVPASDLIAFATDQVPEGDCLFTGTSPNARDFIIIEKSINSATGQIDSMTVVDAATNAPPSTAVTDAAFGFRQPQNEMPRIVCSIMNAGNLSGSVNQVGYTSQIVLKARHSLPDFMINSNP